MIEIERENDEDVTHEEEEKGWAQRFGIVGGARRAGEIEHRLRGERERRRR